MRGHLGWTIDWLPSEDTRSNVTQAELEKITKLTRLGDTNDLNLMSAPCLAVVDPYVPLGFLLAWLDVWGLQRFGCRDH